MARKKIEAVGLVEVQARLVEIHARLVALVNKLDDEIATPGETVDEAFQVLEPLIYDLGEVLGIETKRR